MIGDLRHGFTAERVTTALKAAAGGAFAVFLLTQVLGPVGFALVVFVGLFAYIYHRYP